MKKIADGLKIKNALVSILVVLLCLSLIGCGSTSNNEISGESSKEKLFNEMLLNAKVGDIIEFGSYEQDNDTSNGKEPIEWRVIETQEAGVLVISEKCIDCQEYGSHYAVNWETAPLRTWLNDTFLNSAFTAQEQNRIPEAELLTLHHGNSGDGTRTTDRVFLLSYEEVLKYLPLASERIPKATGYAITEYKNAQRFRYDFWYTRTIITNEFGDCKGVVSFNYEGDFSTFTQSIGCYIRPSIYIQIL